ncbi:MAG: hypothetical protein KY468_20280 [Armatimonadetes bacterium]|nr:hypothetical protein [Armatimonadota bacterium]
MTIFTPLKRLSRLLAPLLALGVSLVLPHGAVAQELPRTIIGDLTRDGKISVADAVRALRISVSLDASTEEDRYRGDVSPTPGVGPRAGKPLGDGRVDVGDALTLLRRAAGFPGGPWADPANPVSFARIHKEILRPGCATSSCHNANARRAGLNLEDPLEAFALMVNHDSTNAAALAQGKKRVVPGKPEESFLVTKLIGPTDEDEGARMPYGADPLSETQINLVKEWIAGGAAFDLDDGTLPDATDPVIDPKAEDVTLPVPPPDKGFQISLGPFDVPRGQEIQRDYFLKTPNTEPKWIKRIDYAYNKGSHHLLIFKSDTADVPDHVETKFGISLDANWQLILGGQNEAFASEYPAGIATYLQPRQQMDFQLHYVNTSTQSTPTGRGKLVANFWYADPSEVTARASFLFGAKVNFSLPPRATTTLSRSVVFPHDVKVFALSGHYHSRGRRYRIFRWDGKQRGALLYESKEWDDPGYQTYTPPLEIKAGTGFTFEAVYQNDTDRTIREGPYAETQEHLFYFGWIYRDGVLNGQDYFDFGF